MTAKVSKRTAARGKAKRGKGRVDVRLAPRPAWEVERVQSIYDVMIERQLVSACKEARRAGLTAFAREIEATVNRLCYLAG